MTNKANIWLYSIDKPCVSCHDTVLSVQLFKLLC